MPTPFTNGAGGERRWLALDVDTVLGALIDLATQPSPITATAFGVVTGVAATGFVLTAATHAATGARHRAVTDFALAVAMALATAWWLAGLVAS